MFDQFDIGAKGYLTRAEFKQFIDHLDLTMTREDKRQMELCDSSPPPAASFES